MRTYQRLRQKELDKYWPKPEQGDIESFWHWMQPRWDLYRGRITQQRIVRYMRDEIPDKWKHILQDGRRVRTRLTHNEVARVRGLVLAHTPSISIPATGDNPKAQKRSQVQSRWAKEFITSLMRPHRPVLQQVLDNVLGDGLGAFEFAMRGHSIYDDISADPIAIPIGLGGQTRQETPAEMKRRIERLTQGAPLPFVVRKIDPMMLLFDEQYDEISRVLIVEYKPQHLVFNDLMKGLKARTGSDDPRLPDPGTPGWGIYDTAVAYSGGEQWYSNALVGDRARMVGDRMVLTMRYYDPRWYMYIVGGVLVDGPVEHKLPSLPVIVCPGMVTGSDMIEEMYEGICWGMSDIEQTLNDLLSLDVDSSFTFGRPRPAIERDPNFPYPDTQSENIDLSGRSAPRLMPGEHVVDMFHGFQYRPSPAVDVLMQIFGRSALSPIAQGAAMSDMAGYAMNSAAQQSLSQYEPVFTNWATALGKLVDLARWTVRDTVKTKVALAVPASTGHTAEWVWLDPNDVDDIHAIVKVDPTAESNKQAVAAQAMQANKDGFMPRREAQIALGAEDPDEWDTRIALDLAREQSLQADIEEAQRRRMFEEAQKTGQLPPGMAPQQGQPEQPGQQGPQGEPGPMTQGTNMTLQQRLDELQRTGGVAAPLNAPEIAPEVANASRRPFEAAPGPAIVNGARVRAGMPNP